MLKREDLIKLFSSRENVAPLIAYQKGSGPATAYLEGLAGSSASLLAAVSAAKTGRSFIFMLPDKESAAYFFNDLENLLGEKELSYEDRTIFFFPSSFKQPSRSIAKEDRTGVLLRSEVLNRLASSGRSQSLIVSYPEALAEKAPSLKEVEGSLFRINKGDGLGVDFLMDVLIEYGFERTDFVVEAGQFSVRGGIIDVFSFSNDFPYRIEIMGGSVESLRTFNPETQLSEGFYDSISLLPEIGAGNKHECILYSLREDTILWSEDTPLCLDIVSNAFESGVFDSEAFVTSEEIASALKSYRLVEFRRKYFTSSSGSVFSFDFSPQASFSKHFELLVKNLWDNTRQGIRNILLFDSQKQEKRVEGIFDTLQRSDGILHDFDHETLLLSLHEGFTDNVNKIACYTDHQIFDRYHRYRIRDKFPGRQALNIKALYNLRPGDYVTHIDHGVGIFSGLEKIEVMGRLQEAIRLVYKNNDILYVSIHSLHRISKYSGREGTQPSLHRLGSNTWANLKKKTKKKVKDIAQDLIKLYARRKAQEGHAFSPDNYMQHELEASFIYEDTPDQEKATAAVKKDMESKVPMDRLICGDVGFGKTEVAIRAAFKAVSDSKQVAVLVPTTILALQHYYTFSERLNDFPVNIDYLSRFRTAREKNQVIDATKKGEVDILIGTHRLLSRDIGFKDLGLLVIDEEQKFGVASKEKLKNLRVNVDTLTLTATPIPRTLQFSLMGARDLSYLNTPPANRYPIITEVHVFNEDLIGEAIEYEVSRGGQVYFVHNRVQNIAEVAEVVKRAAPEAGVRIAHGQLEGSKLEKIMVDFINGEFDILVSTSIIESGLDIPNANTIIINNAHHFGLSDLHQMRGRVGRTNKKAFCYLLSPPKSTLTDEARKRLRSIEEFSELGSGFSIAMRDLDIRGAGNLLGAEQSGFITEVGLDTYHKILDEAISELKEEEFRDVFAGDQAESGSMVSDCHLETDLELMIPSDYVSNIEERVSLYKEIDSIGEAHELDSFAMQMKDRFGPLPEAVTGLLKAVRLRWMAQKCGFGKLIIKGGRIIAHMPGSEKSDYYHSDIFGSILGYVQANPRESRIRESGNYLVLEISNVPDIETALIVLSNLSGSR